ncbi:MAG TPA: ABC transporter substrate-binding protein, partial [Burkholderiaceae bacterium]|nr:ABC transporter substrate-binding protein [Burkholderiaceae bacterium]
VPSPWERKREIAREYQDAARKASPNPEFNYGALEGYMTAKVLVMALRTIPAKELSRASLVKALYSTPFDVGGLMVRFEPGNHEGSRFVDLSIFSREGRFIH